jgi:hypothetical protein
VRKFTRDNGKKTQLTLQMRRPVYENFFGLFYEVPRGKIIPQESYDYLWRNRAWENATIYGCIDNYLSYFN